MNTPFDRLTPRALLGQLRSATWSESLTWPVLVIPTPWLFINQLYFCDQAGMSAPAAIGWSALGVVVHVVVTAVLVWGVAPLVQSGFGLWSVSGLQLGLFAVSGVVRAWLMVWAIGWNQNSVVQWGWLSASWALDIGVWTASSAILVSWGRRARLQRWRLEVEYQRQLLTQIEDARALAETDAELAAVRTGTRQALTAIQRLLHPAMTADELSACVALIDKTIADSVRPTSHELAREQDQALPVEAPALWRPWYQLIGAIVRSWSQARPFQPGLVGLLSLPMVLFAEFVPPPHRLDEASSLSVAVLGLHLLLLFVADRALGPQLRRLAPRVSASAIISVYVVMYLLGLTALILASATGMTGSLEAFLLPPLLAMISGGISAGATAWSTESAAARAIIRRTEWGVRFTHQQLWARRRRLALALHGRVQANLTAASLMLAMARTALLKTGELDDAEIDRIRGTLDHAELIDEAPASAPAERLTNLAEVWQGVLNVELDLRPEGEALLSAVPDAADACIEVVREVLLNAVRHSRATHADVVIGADAPGLLCVRVTERVATRVPLGAVGGPGLGRTLIDSLAVDWAESDTEEGRITVALLAAGVGGSGAQGARSRLNDVSMLR